METAPKKRNRFATFSLILGVVAIFMVFDTYYALFLGSIALLFAHLSKGERNQMNSKAVAGTITGLVAVVGTIVISVLAMLLLVHLFGFETVSDPDALEKALTELYNQLLENLQMTGGGSL